MIKITPFVFGMLFVAFAGIPRLALAQSSDERSIKDGVDDVMSRLVKISEHGDLKDDQFFGEAIGIRMIEFPKRKAPFAFKVCGVSSGAAVEVTPYQFVDAPWFLAEEGRNSNKSPCEYGLLKEINNNGIVTKATANLNINTAKICLAEADIKKYFIGLTDYTPSPPGIMYLDHHESGVSTLFIMSLGSKSPKCVEHVILSEKY